MNADEKNTQRKIRIKNSWGILNKQIYEDKTIYRREKIIWFICYNATYIQKNYEQEDDNMERKN